MADKDFESTLNLYRQNLTEYKLTGNSAFKTAADTARVWLDKYVTTLRQDADKKANDIQTFVARYQNTNPELMEMQERIKKVQQEGPIVQDQYDTEMEAQQQEPIDFTHYYTKVALIAGTFAVVVVAALL